jgi:hypothetical protein
MTPSFLKLSYLAWTVPLLALWLVYQAIGLPHAIWSYSWIDNGHGINLSVPRVYTRCRYIGPYGEFDVAAMRGHCGLVRFFKEGAPQ